ncbi:hypothetical protein BDM02DRAFT_3130867, partial [Thelephora ganbajun]
MYHDVPGNITDSPIHSDDMGDVEVRPPSPGARHAKKESVVSKLGTTRRRAQRHPAQPKRRHHMEYSQEEDGSDPEDTIPQPLHAEVAGQQLLVALQTKTFDQLLDRNVGNEGLTLEVKKVEMASHDLITLVRNLTRVTTLNDYMLQTITAANTPPPSFITHILSFSVYARNPTKNALIETFLLSMDAIGNHMFCLCKEAEVSMGHLICLEEHLPILCKMVYQENKELAAATGGKGWFTQGAH